MCLCMLYRSSCILVTDYFDYIGELAYTAALVPHADTCSDKLKSILDYYSTCISVLELNTFPFMIKVGGGGG